MTRPADEVIMDLCEFMYNDDGLFEAFTRSLEIALEHEMFNDLPEGEIEWLTNNITYTIHEVEQ